MTGGFYYSKKNKNDVALKSAIEKIAGKESRSISNATRGLLWVAVALYNKKRRVVSEKEIPENNPIQKIVSARA